MNSELDAVLKRFKPEKRTTRLVRRELSRLPFLTSAKPPLPKFLYDTTVYIDILQQRFPTDGETVLRAADAWHSPITDAELIAPVGFLDPQHSETARSVKAILEVLEKRPAHRILYPDREVWLTAGVLAGIVARLQGYQGADRIRLLHNALLFASARKHGLTVLTRNLVEFDYFQQLDPFGKVLFYERI